MIYLDNAAGSFPKPAAVATALAEAHAQFGANPGRGNYALTRRTAAMVEAMRARLCRLVGAPQPERMIFTAGATMSLNMAIFGLVQPGSHVITSSMEHNAVLRPLTLLEDQGLIALSHASNVCGSVQPVAEIGRLAKAAAVPFLVDAAQSGGLLPLDVSAMGISLLALAGHKALYGPAGIGALYVAEDVSLRPLLSFTVDGLTATEVAELLDQAGICVRAGYHCAPAAHRTLESFDEGSVRISPGWFNSELEMAQTAEVLAKICS